VTQEEEDHRCDRAPGATYENPGGNDDPDPFTKYLDDAFAVTTYPAGYEGSDVYLHYGTTYWVPGGNPAQTPWYLDDWGGWGYRHILAKHGWSELDQQETEEALVDDADPSQTPNGNWDYETPLSTPGQGGVSCTRTVIVDFRTGNGDPGPRGVVTSFNKVA
jgi:hypothetical protein